MEWVTREHPHSTPQSRGLEAIAHGFRDIGMADNDQLAAELPVHAAVYAWCRRQAGAA